MHKTLSLPLRLAVLVAGTALPLIVFSTALVFLDYYTDRQTAAERVLETARSMRLVLDRELQSSISALRVLALSPTLQRGDIAAFRAEAETFAQQYPESPNVLLSERTGQELLNLRVPAGALLPKRAGAKLVEQVFATGRPVVSDLYTGSVTGRLLISIDVPVFKAGGVIYDLAFTPSFQIFRTIIAQQRPSEEWVISIFDGTGRNVARLPGAEQYLGAQASATLLPHILSTTSEAVLETTSLEETPLLTAFTRSQLSSWSVAVGMPTASLTEPLWRTLIVTLVIGMILLAVGLGFSVRMATRMARAEAHRELLINELNHRVKNTLAIVQSIAVRTFRNTAAEDARAAFEARLVALARAHNILSEESWENADLRAIVVRALEPYVAEDPRLSITGADVRLSPQTALAVAMVLHELATNAAKYGALTRPTGRVSIDWQISGAGQKRRLALHWREAGGPPVEKPTHKGFGLTLIERGIGQELSGTAALSFAPGGLECTMEFPLT